MSPDPTLDTNCILLAEADDAYAPYRSQGKGDAQAEAALRCATNRTACCARKPGATAGSKKASL